MRNKDAHLGTCSYGFSNENLALSQVGCHARSRAQLSYGLRG